MSSTRSSTRSVWSTSVEPSVLRKYCQYGDVIYTILSESLTSPSYEGVAVLATVSGDDEFISMVLPEEYPSDISKVQVPIASIQYCEVVPLIPIKNVCLDYQPRWTYTSARSFAEELMVSKKSLLGSKVHKRTDQEFGFLQSLLWRLDDLEQAVRHHDWKPLGRMISQRVAYLSWLCLFQDRKTADFLFQCLEEARPCEPASRPSRSRELFNRVPRRLCFYLAEGDLLPRSELRLDELSSFPNFKGKELGQVSLELDSLLLQGNKVKCRTLHRYLFVKSLLLTLLDMCSLTPTLWDTCGLVSLGEDLLQEILLLERLASTGDTAHVDSLRELFDLTEYPDRMHSAIIGAKARQNSEFLHFLPLSSNNYTPLTAAEYYQWSVKHYSRSVLISEGALRSTGDSTSHDHRSNVAFSSVAQASNASGPVVEGVNTVPSSLRVTNPLGRRDVRTSSQWLKRGFTEKVSSAQQPVGLSHGLTDLDSSSIEDRRREVADALETEQESGSSRRWLSYFIEDFYNLNYHMFLDFSEWIKPKRSFTRQGDLAPIVTNLINLEKLEQLDPELTYFYNILRHDKCFDDLTIPGKTTSVKDRVRLMQNQVSQAEGWDVIEEIDYKPPGLPVGMFTVPKKPPNPDLRLIVDGRPWNQTQIRPEKMPIPKLLDTILGIQGMNYAVQYDGVSFFYQFPIRHDRFYFRRRGKHYRFCRMPMGWSWAPLIAQRTANAILAEVLRRLKLEVPDASVYTACWVDNFLLAAKTEAHLRVLEKIFLEVAEEVSMKVKKEDQVDNQHTVFAGIEHDLVNHRYRPVASSHQVEEVETVRDVMKACGTAIWQLYARGSRLCFYEHLISTVSRLCSPAMRGECEWDAKIERHLRKEDSADLAELKTIGANLEWETVGHSRATLDDSIWFDASSLFWGFVSDSGHKGGQGRFASPEQLHIFVKEGIAFLSSVHCTIPEFRGRHRVFYTDNQPLAKAFQKGHSSSRLVNEILRQVFTILREHDATLELIWIPTDKNKADKFTRGASISMPRQYKERVFEHPLVRKHTHHSMEK